MATVRKGCPICEADVKGDSNFGYFCKKCNLVFRNKHVDYSFENKKLKKRLSKDEDELPVRSRNSEVYCPCAENIKEENKVKVSSKAGLRKCQLCF